MLCANCEKEFDAAKGDCPYCGAVPEVDAKVLQEEEKKSFSGITIDESGNNNDNEGYTNKNQHDYSGIYVKKISFGSGFLSQLLIWLILAIVVFVLLPTFLVVFLVLAVIWFIFRLLFR